MQWYNFTVREVREKRGGFSFGAAKLVIRT